MIHFEEEQFVLAYYGEIDEVSRRHLEECDDCRAEFRRLRDLLDSVRDYPVPERKGSYGSDVWLRLAPQLNPEPPAAKSRTAWFRWWVLAPALATLVVVAFVAGIMTGERQTGISVKARERVLLMAISDHFDRTQILLTELVHENPESSGLTTQRDTARELLTENRLLRQSAVHMGDVSDADLLDALERVLLDFANSSAASPNSLMAIQQRIDNDALLFKVRISGADAREKGQKL
jgi:hypothetical protein